MRKDIIHLTDGNGKMKYTGKANHCHVWTFSIPAGHTCPFKGACVRFCYASTGNYTCPEPRACYARNLAFSQNPHFASFMLAEVREAARLDAKRGLNTVIRLHDTGDFYSRKYLADWIEIAHNCRDLLNVSFYAYSKSVPWVQEVQDLFPRNFEVILSECGTHDHLLPKAHARVVPVGYVPTEGEFLGGKDDLANLRAIRRGETLCLEAHGARKGAVK